MDGYGENIGGCATAASAPQPGCEIVATDAMTTRECVELLRESCVGRLGVSDQAMPMILPVHFSVYNDWVVVRTHEGSVMAEAARNAVVAFEADQADFTTRTGWSVMVVGHASLVSGGVVFDQLSALDLCAWASDGADRYIVIKMERVSGRRLSFGVESGTGIHT